MLCNQPCPLDSGNLCVRNCKSRSTNDEKEGKGTRSGLCVNGQLECLIILVHLLSKPQEKADKFFSLCDFQACIPAGKRSLKGPPKANREFSLVRRKDINTSLSVDNHTFNHVLSTSFNILKRAKHDELRLSLDKGRKGQVLEFVNQYGAQERERYQGPLISWPLVVYIRKRHHA